MKKFFALLIFMMFCQNVLASSQTKRPGSDDAATGGAWAISPASSANYYSHVSETAADDSAVIYTTAAGRITFGISSLTIPTEAISTTVTVHWRAKQNNAGASNLMGILKIGGGYYGQPTLISTAEGAYVNYSYSYVTSPATGLGWTPATINAIQAFGLTTTAVAGIPICSQTYLTVTYALPSGYTNIEDYGFTGVDDSAAFKSAIEAAGATLNSTVFVPKENSAWLVKPTTYGSKQRGCISPSDNMTILFADGTTLCPVAGSMTANANNVMFELLNANGVTITSNGVWYGYMRKEEFTQPSQFNHFASFRSANGCMINGGAISGTGGDCLFIGSEQSYPPCTNITVSNMLLDKASRHSVGVNNVDTLSIQGSILSNSSGAGTACGIDFESDWGGNTTYASQFKNISVYHCSFSGNTEAAILFHWGLLNGSDPKANTVTVTVEGCTISGYGFLNMTGIKSVGPILGGPVGQVTINDCILNSITGRALWLSSHDSTTANFKFSNNTFSNFCLDGTTQLNLINADATYPLAGSYYGNFTFENNVFNDSRGATNYILEAFKQVSTAGFFGLFGYANTLVGSSPFTWYIPNPRLDVTPIATIMPEEWTPTATPTATATVTPTVTPTATSAAVLYTQNFSSALTGWTKGSTGSNGTFTSSGGNGILNTNDTSNSTCEWSYDNGYAWEEYTVTFTIVSKTSPEGNACSFEFVVRNTNSTYPYYYGYSFKHVNGTGNFTFPNVTWGTITTNSSFSFSDGDTVSIKVLGSGASTSIEIKQNTTVVFAASNPSTVYNAGTISFGVYGISSLKGSWEIDDILVDGVGVPTVTSTITPSVTPTSTISATSTLTPTVTLTPTPVYFSIGKNITISSPNHIIDDGTYLWISDNSGYITKAEISTGNTLAKFALPGGQPNSITICAGWGWSANSGGKISQFSLTGNSEVANYTICNRTLMDVASDGKYLWIADYGLTSPDRGWVWKFDTDSNTIVSYTYIDDKPLALAMDNIGYIWCTTVIGKIAKIIRESAVVEAYVPDDWHPLSILFNGSNYWDAATNRVTKFDPISNSVTAQITGLGNPYGIAWNGKHIFSCDQAEPKVWALNPANSSLVYTLSLPEYSNLNNMHGIPNGSAWVCHQTGILEIVYATLTATPTPTTTPTITATTTPTPTETTVVTSTITPTSVHASVLKKRQNINSGLVGGFIKNIKIFFSEED